MKHILILTSILLLTACQSKEVSKPPVIKNKYPIEFVGNKYFEFNRPYDSTIMGGDSFPVYSITNKSIDTIWIVTVKEDNCYALKDSSIKIIYENRTVYHRVGSNLWRYMGEIVGRDGCTSVKLYPNQATYFIIQQIEGCINDSEKNDIVVKVKKGLKIKDSTVTKKLILNKDHFVEDTSDWSKVFFRF
jgi:hypothetical protein